MNQPKTHNSIPDQVADELRGLILDGTIGPGQRINVRDFERRLNVSHIPIREAIRLLEAEGLVESRPNVGAVATEVSLQELEEVYDLRRIIEPPVARRAIGAMGDDHIDLLHEALDALNALDGSADGMDDDYIAAHRRFHWLLLAPGSTPVIERSLERLWGMTERYMRLTRGAAIPVADAQHADMVALCERRDADGLAELLGDHLHLTANTLQVLYGEDAPT